MWLASAPSRSCSTEYWPAAVAAVLAFNCLNSPQSGVDRPPSGPAFAAGEALASGSAGPGPGSRWRRQAAPN